jgi:hypothetical protein
VFERQVRGGLLVQHFLLAMGRRQKGIEGEIAHHESLAREGRVNGDRAIIRAILDLNDWAVPHVKASLVTLSLWPETGKIKDCKFSGVAVTETCKKAIRKISGTVETIKVGKKNAPLMIEDQLPSNVNIVKAVPSKYWSVGALSATLYQDRLHALSPTMFSYCNMRSLKLNAAAEGVKSMLERLYEFVTGISPSFRLVQEFRCFEYLDSYAKANAEARMDRQNRLNIRAEWEIDGVYAIDLKISNKTHIVVKMRHMDASKKFAAKGLGKIDDLYIEHNWSEKTAAIKNKKVGAIDVCLISQFGDVIQLINDKVKGDMLSIEDETEQDPEGVASVGVRTPLLRKRLAEDVGSAGSVSASSACAPATKRAAVTPKTPPVVGANGFRTRVLAGYNDEGDNA